ncbi:hypothetical protein X975_20237, partial [Stegodyphus mimosarum]
MSRSGRKDQKCVLSSHGCCCMTTLLLTNLYLTMTFLQKTKTSVLPHPTYLPDLTPCDFFLFPELAICLQGR